MNQQNIEQQLWSFIDGTSTLEERSVVEKLLGSNLEWKNKYQELLEIHQALSDADLEQPSLRFTKNVMEGIAKYQISPATKNYINKKIIWGIAGFFITLIISFLIYGFSQIDWNEGGTTKLPIDFSQVDFSKFFNNNFVNGFIMVNLLLGLVLLDRILASKRKKFPNETNAFKN